MQDSSTDWRASRTPATGWCRSVHTPAAAPGGAPPAPTGRPSSANSSRPSSRTSSACFPPPSTRVDAPPSRPIREKGPPSRQGFPPVFPRRTPRRRGSLRFPSALRHLCTLSRPRGRPVGRRGCPSTVCGGHWRTRGSCRQLPMPGPGSNTFRESFSFCPSSLLPLLLGHTGGRLVRLNGRRTQDVTPPAHLPLHLPSDQNKIKSAGHRCECVAGVRPH